MKLNLGCGSRHHPDWVNLDIQPDDGTVMRWDVTLGLPFDDAAFDAVYHSHLIEHLRTDEVHTVMTETVRVCRPGGVVRIVVPDLERICREYLRLLDDSLAGKEGASAEYDWIMLEMYDQTVREESGGRMEQLRRTGGLRRAAGRSLRAMARRMMTRRQRALSIGRFRLSGEVHQWMYDRFSLARLMESHGLIEPKVVGPEESQIDHWPSYHLDVLTDGKVAKPDSLYMEARRP